MGVFWTLSGVKEAAVIEFGCMGHNLYGGSALKRAGIYEGLGADLYTTHIDETDISLGDTSRLYDTIAHVVREARPKAIFLQPSAVPEVIGTDLAALVNIMQRDFPGTPLIPAGRGSFAITAHRGVQEALFTLVSVLPKPVAEREPNKFNIIGSCPDLFRYAADSNEIIRMMKGAFGMAPLCVLSSSTDITRIEQMGSARINLVLRREGVPAGQYLKERFGAPYLYARPYGVEGSSGWLVDVGEMLGRAPDAAFVKTERELALAQIDLAYDYLEGSEWSYPEEAVLTIGGHRDVVEGVLTFATNEMPLRRGVCWCDCPDMADEDIPFFTEDEWTPVVKNHAKGYLMFSGEALQWAGKNTQLTIANPDCEWRIHPYEPPFVGFRGAVHLINLWINEYARTH